MSHAVMLLAFVTVLGFAHVNRAAEPQLSHVVYFKLKENSQANKEKLVVACHKYLSGHPGTVFFTSGVLAADLSREVNDKDFDVSLIVVFRNKAAHDAYQKHPRHLKFIAENQELWSGVRVFDSYLPVVESRETD